MTLFLGNFQKWPKSSVIEILLLLYLILIDPPTRFHTKSWHENCIENIRSLVKVSIMRLARYCLFLLLLFSITAECVRIKDITNIAGVRENQLIGYGLVVGLDGTGDKTNQIPFTQQTFNNMLIEFGIRLPKDVNLSTKNVAAVAVSATLPPFAKSGQKIDVTVLSVGNATSLRGGQLLLTPLRGADGQVYAMSQGSVVVSGFGALGQDGSKVTVNVTASGRIINGATVEKTILMPFVQDGVITFELMQPDFTTAERIEKAINRSFGYTIAHAIDASAIRVRVDNEFSYRGPYDPSHVSVKGEAQVNESIAMSRYVPLIARIENLMLEPADVKAKIIVNSRTGTIVVGQDVTIEPVCVSHGNLAVTVTERPYVSQPQGFSNGRTVKGSASDININQTTGRTFEFAPGPSLKDVVDAINAVGAAPGDLIAILEAIKAAGALHADIEVI
ncbi:MAG TPA: flagellar basal body P-ring protein FlgI [Candidatus Babeliaceae bacterium]|nr:flagellar basal body P-ring protein FlgI [Candidatus Babeliaceae bacterium]